MALEDDPIELDGEIALNGLESLRLALLERLQPGRRVSLRTERLSSASLALVQLLYAAHALAARRGAALDVGCPEGGALAAALAALGFRQAVDGLACAQGVWRTPPTPRSTPHDHDMTTP